MANIFKNVSVDIPNKSGFDMSHENLFSSFCGTLTPALVDTLLPGDKVNLDAITNVQLPPFASDFYGRIELKFEAFFVPFRLLYGGWKEFITIPLDFVNGTRPEVNGNLTYSYQIASTVLPSITVQDGVTNPSSNTLKFSDYLGAGSLADFLGYKLDPSTINSSSEPASLGINVMPFLAYHKIWDDWYRDSRLSSSCFAKYNPSSATSSTYGYIAPSFLPYITIYKSSSIANSELNRYSFQYAQGDVNISSATKPHLFDLRQRSFAKDYFTNSTPLPQAGNQQSVGFNVNTSTGAGSFSIASLRAANSIQTWLERNNLAGNRYPDQIKANFGVYPSDSATDRCLYLGRLNVPVYAKSVYQTAPSAFGTSPVNLTRNPIESQGATFGSPQGVKSGRLADFTASEHGYLFVMASLVPTAYYSTGISRYLMDTKVTDFGWPLLQGTGDEPIFTRELTRDPWNSPNIITFGYTQRYSHFKFMNDEIHGLLRDGESLEAFALQRSFENGSTGLSTPNISTVFNEIPRNFLDQVSSISQEQSRFGYWCDTYFKYYKISTLSAYSVPTLGDLKNVHKERIPLGGKRL